MVNLTIRNIPNDIINKIKVLSQINKRSMNSEILLLLETGIHKKLKAGNEKRQISKNTQINIWKKLSGLWKDDRNTDQIINDIYSNRTSGRDFTL
ncbi:MAG TPA: Arc family DNA-binding protein [Spirochaetota bacterium]|jgi:plasmid stability protein|nr:MAG: hypothetical protein BWX91_01641 [Spirochaetes bacterium ADurb.Bin133]HNZ26233.1 Arc family DNA-binding protein [Spirochaetota bacterium]HOF01061.1 Arc family DNA-binding protein [Spirochaetota bacterium]HOS33028.1 Arc family DNA-binding protein [Spirochaetota bacterium]HOS55969.1 Arc family DNA-binding protein [Spirochaetota bacterium]